MTSKRRSGYDLSRFPKVHTLSNGTKVTLRPMVASDEKGLLAFFRQVPEQDRRYLKDDVVSPQVIHRWATDIDYSSVLPLLAEVDGKIVADASLHRSPEPQRADARELRTVVDPAYRNQGLGAAMILELLDLARRADLSHIIFELAEVGEAAAVKMAERLGFKSEALLMRKGRDQRAQPYDLLIMELYLKGEPPRERN